MLCYAIGVSLKGVAKSSLVTIYGYTCALNLKYFRSIVYFKTIDEQGNTWLVGQYRFPLDEYSWEIPMGGGPIGIDILESAKKELKEETGITASKWKNICRIHTSNSATDEEGFIFLAQELTFGETEFEDTEDLQIKKIPFKEAVNWVMEGKITDAISIAGILKVEILLNKKASE